MNKSLLATATALAMGVGITAASADQFPDQATMRLKCVASLCAIDQNGRGQVVGLVGGGAGSGASVLFRLMGGTWYQLNWSTSLGFDDNAVLSYTESNCHGQPYFPVGYLIGPGDLFEPNAAHLTSPAPAGWDFATGAIWGPVGSAQEITVASFYYEGQCFAGSWGATQILAAPAMEIDTTKIKTPLKIQ